jgi:hypothetical protein
MFACATTDYGNNSGALRRIAGFPLLTNSKH